MDVLKLCDLLFDDEDLKDVPVEFIFRVAYAVVSLIASGECLYKTEFD